MDFDKYLNLFREASEGIDTDALRKKQIDVAVSVALDSVVLKLYKKSWTNHTENPLTDESRIFFSLWLNDSSLKEGKLLYNIHALKLRTLKGYAIESRVFAASFRTAFRKHQSSWPHVSVNYGPSTLMQGWITLDEQRLVEDIQHLANNFFEIEYLVDETLSAFKKPEEKTKLKP